MLRIITIGTMIIMVILSHQQNGQPYPESERFSEEIMAFEQWDRKNSHPEAAILFVGSSSIRLWPTAEMFDPLKVINRGFGGAHISDINFYFDRVVGPYDPAVIVFYCGDNDVAAGKSARQVLHDYEAFIDLVRESFHELPVIYLPIKPSSSRWEFWPEMSETNRLIANLSENEENLYFIDTVQPMLSPAGRPRGELFVEDRLHLNRTGYELWTSILKPWLTRLLESTQ